MVNVGKYTSPMDAMGYFYPHLPKPIRSLPFPDNPQRPLVEKIASGFFSVESFFGPFESMLFLEDSAAQG